MKLKVLRLRDWPVLEMYLYILEMKAITLNYTLRPILTDLSPELREGKYVFELGL